MKTYHPFENTLPTTGFLRLPQVLELIPVSRSTWWANVKLGKFPPPVKLGTNTTAWKAEDIYALIKSLENGCVEVEVKNGI